MLRTDALAELRAVLDDTVAPYAWSDDRLVRFLALGQTQFCRDTGFFRDSTNYALTTVSGQISYPLAPEIIQVFSLWDGTSQINPDLQTILFDAPARPFGWKAYLDTRSLTLSAPPDGVYTLNMRVWRAARLPFDRQMSGQYVGEFEIPDEFHFAPIEWAAAKCFGDHDRERQDPVKAADHRQNYRDIVKEGKRAFRRICGGMTELVPSSLYCV